MPFATNANSAAVDPRFLNSPEFEKKFFFTIFPIVKCDGAKDNSPAAGFDFFESDLFRWKFDFMPLSLCAVMMQFSFQGIPTPLIIGSPL